MPKVIVNDKEIEVPAGTSALDAVFHAGFDAPYFCSNEYLSPIGACRMCLVEAGSPRKNPDGTFIMDESTGQPKIFFFPGPVASCTLAVSDGMVIQSSSEAVVKAQAGMMEFTLLNHPLDCPTCDKGGACELQDRAYEYGYGEARFEFTRRHADKHHALSDFIVLDKERCIHCKRCVRYFEEIPGEEMLDFIERGGHTFIDSFESEDLAGRDLGNFSGNINDLCPVGALLDNVARFRGRNWEYDRVRTTNMTDADGAAIWVDARTGRIERIRAAHNPQVNEIWINDAARFGHEWVDADSRIRQPMVRRNGRLEPATWDEAVAAIKAGLTSVARDRIGLYTAADITLEEGLALEKFADAIGTPSVDHFPRWTGALSSVNRPTFTELAKADAVLVLGADLYEESGTAFLRIEEMLKGYVSELTYNHGTALADLKLQERMPRKRNRLVVFAPTFVKQMEHAGISDVYPVGTEADVLRTLSSLRGNPDQDAPESLKRAAKMLAEAKNAVIVLGSFALSGNAAEVLTMAGRLGVKVLPIPAGANGAGLEYLDLVPDKHGVGFGEFTGLQAAFVSGLSVPDVARLKGMSFLVVHDSNLTALAGRADVVLPRATNYEKRGTTVNAEGRFLPVQTAAVDGGESVDLIGAIAVLADAMDVKLEVRGTRSAQRALKDRFGLEFDKIPEAGSFPTKKVNAKTAPRTVLSASEDTVLIAPRMWSERMLAGSSRVREAVGPDTMTLSTQDAAKHALRDGFELEIEVAGRPRHVVIKLDDRTSLPTIHALETDLPGSSAPLRIAVGVGGDD
jgi:NADH-quinone oxidoreductase subunit G